MWVDENGLQCKAELHFDRLVDWKEYCTRREAALFSLFLCLTFEAHPPPLGSHVDDSEFWILSGRSPIQQGWKTRSRLHRLSL